MKAVISEEENNKEDKTKETSKDDIDKKAKNLFKIDSLESQHSLWERIHIKYLPRLTEKVYYHKDQVLYYLSKKTNDNDHIKSAQSFYTNLASSFPNFSFSYQPQSKDPITFNNLTNPSSSFESTDEEMLFLSHAILSIQKKNQSILQSDNTIQSKSSDTEQFNETNTLLHYRLENLCYQISSYQMRIIASNISIIQKNHTNQQYYITYDPASELSPMTLSQSQYDTIKKYKEPIIVTITEPTKNIYESPQMILRSHEKKTSLSIIGNNVGIKLPFCHVCKLRKEDVVKCTNNPMENIVNIKELIVNNTTVFFQNEIYFVNNMKSSILREIIYDYFDSGKVKGANPCNNYVCLPCIKTVTATFNSANDASKYICPKCNVKCNCTTCRNEIQFIKLVAYFLSIKWDIDYVYNYCMKRFPLLQMINKDRLIWNRFVLLDFKESDNAHNEELKRNMDLLEPLKEYKIKLEDYQKTMTKFFTETQEYKDDLWFLNEGVSNKNNNANT